MSSRSIYSPHGNSAPTPAQIATVCPSKQLFDMSGVDSFLAPVVSLITLFICQKIFTEDYYSKPRVRVCVIFTED